mgnify:FL=1
MNTEQKFATFFGKASLGRKLGAVMVWLASVMLVVALFVPAYKVTYADNTTGEKYKLVEADYADLQDQTKPATPEEEAACDILAGKPTSVTSYLTKAEKGFAQAELNHKIVEKEAAGWVAPVLLGVFAALVIIAVVTSLFTMNVISFVAVAGAVVELLLVYFLRFTKHANIAITDYCKEALSSYLPGSTPKPGMHLVLILLIVAAVVLALVGVILTYAVKGKAAPEENYDWDDAERNSDTGIVNINAGGNAGGSMGGNVGSGTENEVVATLVQMNTGKVFMLKNNTEMVLGKGSAADIIIPNPIISRTHAKIICSRGVCTLQDLGSKNGTFVGDDKIPAGSSVVLNSGAYITLGNEIFEFNA